MWTEQADGTMSVRKICPIMSDSRGIIYCQGKNCAAAYPVSLMGEIFWVCELIEGHCPSRETEDRP